MIRYYQLVVAIFLSLDCLALGVSGTVTDRANLPVQGARVTFENLTTLVKYFGVTDMNGQYFIDTPTSVETGSAYNTLVFCYPNPFNRQTVISFHLELKQRVELAVYNIAGQRVRIIYSGVLESGRHQMVWDGLSHQGAPVDPGFYIGSLQTSTSLSSVKMIVLGGENFAAPVWSSAEEESVPKALTETSQLYNVTIDGSGFEDHYVYHVDMTGVSEKDFVINRAVWTPFSTTGDYLGIYNGKDYTPIFVKGVNLGAAVPGSGPGQLAISTAIYYRWFQQIADAGFNTVRIYTLHFPRFYETFAQYNQENPDKPLYLLHGVWLDEEYPVAGAMDDLYSFTETFDNEIQNVVDCIHGNVTIPPKTGVAYGQYSTDISPWVLGLVIGREIHAIEVAMTNLIHKGITAYSGVRVAISGATPTEVWAVERIDKLISYERTHYKSTRPVSWSSWPTLDPMTHSSEDPGSDEDAETIDLNEMNLVDAPGGYFASYHAYPYYPNFINWDAAYQNATDDAGINPYLAYLHDLRKHYTNFPLLITEFGVPSSYGNARYSLSGMHHGGLTEEQQGNSNMRMLRNIYDTDCGGGVMFSWMDEWFKRTWISNPISSERRALWHNICNPENNFGLIRFSPNPQFYHTRKTTNVNSSKVSNVDMWHDFTFINIEASLKIPFISGDTLWVAFDTYKPDVGESTLPNGKKLIGNRAEFLLRVTPDSANLYVIKSYHLLGRGLVFKQLCDATTFQTQTTDGSPWQLLQWQNGAYWEGREALPFMQDIGKLGIHVGNATLAAHECVQIRNNRINIRIPWTLLNFSDPSSGMVVDDNQSVETCCQSWACGMKYLITSKTDGINATLIYKEEVMELTTYQWDQWNVNSLEILNPEMFIEEEKASLTIIREGLKNTPFVPKTK